MHPTAPHELIFFPTFVAQSTSGAMPAPPIFQQTPTPRLIPRAWLPLSLLDELDCGLSLDRLGLPLGLAVGPSGLGRHVRSRGMQVYSLHLAQHPDLRGRHLRRGAGVSGPAGKDQAEIVPSQEATEPDLHREIH